jgi:hypothetical protein
MPLQPGDWVRTETGEIGKVVTVSKLTIFVELQPAKKGDTAVAYLASQLTKIKPPATT